MSDLRQNVRPELRELAQRITKAVETAGGIGRVSKAIGKSRATIDRWMNAQNEPGAREIAALSEVSGFEIGWISSGQGEQIRSQNVSQVSDIVLLPILDVSASAGTGYLNHNEEVVAHLPFPAGFLKTLGVNPEKVRAVRSRGDSMEPTIPDDRLVLVNTADRDISRSRIFLIRTADGLRLKRILRTHDGAILLISDNKGLYPEERIEGSDLETLKVIGRAFWTERLI